MRRHRNVVRAALDELDGLAAHAADDLPVVGVLRHLDRARVGDHRVDTDDERRTKRLVPHALRLGLVLREPVTGGRHQRHRLVVDDLAAVVADVRDAGLGVVADHESRGDVRAAVVGAVARHGQNRQVDVVAEDDVLVHGTVVDVSSAGCGFSAARRSRRRRSPRCSRRRSAPWRSSCRRRRRAGTAVPLSLNTMAGPATAALLRIALATSSSSATGRSTSMSSPCARSASRNSRKSWNGTVRCPILSSVKVASKVKIYRAASFQTNGRSGARSSMGEPRDAFRTFALDVTAPTVSPTRQSSFRIECGVDVNVLLFAAFVGAVRGWSFAAEDLRVGSRPGRPVAERRGRPAARRPSGD